MTTVRKLVTEWGFEVDDASLKKMEQQTTQLRASFVKLGAVATAALAAVVVPAVQLQAAIKDTLTLSEETGTAFAELEKGMTAKALSLAEKLGFSATEVAKGFYQVLSTGAKALSPEFDSLSEIALKMAKTVGLEPSVAIEKLSDTIKTFQLEGTKAEHVANVLFTSSKLAATTVPQLTDAMSIAAPAAVAFNVSLEATSAALAILAEGGIKSQRAGTGLQGIFLRLANAAGPAGKALKEMGLSAFTSAGEAKPFSTILSELNKKLSTQTDAQRLANLQLIAGQEHFKTMGVLLASGADRLDVWTAKNRESAKAIEQAFNIKMSAASEQAEIFWITIKNLAATLGEPLLVPLGKVLKRLSEFIISVREFLSLNPELVKLIATWGGLTLVVVILGSAMGIAATSMKLFAISMASAGIAVAATMFWMIALAAMLAVLVGLIFVNRDAFLEFIKINKDADWTQIAFEFGRWILGVKEGATVMEELAKATRSVGDAWLFLEGSLQKTLAGFRRMLGLTEQAPESIVSKMFGNIGKMAITGKFTPGESSIGAGTMGAIPALGQTIVNSNTVGDLTVNVDAPGGNPQEIANAVEDRLNQWVRGTAADLGQ